MSAFADIIYFDVWGASATPTPTSSRTIVSTVTLLDKATRPVLELPWQSLYSLYFKSRNTRFSCRSPVKTKTHPTLGPFVTTIAPPLLLHPLSNLYT
jgi:hypothetical protein